MMHHYPDNRYHTLSMALHWAMLLLLVAVYGTIELREWFPKGSDPREALKLWHYLLGLSVLWLVGLRMAVRMMSQVPPIIPEPAAWEAKWAKVIHGALYALMVLMPVLGWLIVSAEGKQMIWFGLEWPALIGEHRELAKLFEEVHETLGSAGYFLIGLHAVAALYHHYVKRDNTLYRMLPWPASR